MSRRRNHGAALVLCLGLGVGLVPMGSAPVRANPAVQQPVTSNDLVTLVEQVQREEQQNQLDAALATYGHLEKSQQGLIQCVIEL